MSGDWSNVTIDFTDHDESSSLFDPNYTYSNDKYSCIRGFFFAHIVCNYFIFLSGIGCFVTRVAPQRFKWLHSWFGRIYILSMLWSTVTSTLITNTGLPLATIISFGAVMGGLTVGWIAIIIHKQKMERSAITLVHEKLLQQSSKGIDNESDLNQMLQDAKVEVAESKTFKERFFSLKTLHGTLFFVSWMQITGRIFASNQSGDFTCHTYPVYKPINTAEGDYDNGNLTLVPTNDPDWDRLPWSNGVVAWSMQIILGSLFGALAVGAIWSWRAARVAERKKEAMGPADRRQTDALTTHVPNDTETSVHTPEGDFVDEEKDAANVVETSAPPSSSDSSSSTS
uniref:Uncharacterized protein n=1 Tax=Pseudictyota dubia TaxID=2749911 RepID=A0A7R9VIB9_9STRA|mmetsp:Transcript_14063/g.26536  ORF Transcript_14063/g.26536 Transcript_14063/m.26536 type:complete len:341 (+) Transcript_14063:195-1217(+)